MASEILSVAENRGTGFEHASWQDVYASYGCSLEFDGSDDDG